MAADPLIGQVLCRRYEVVRLIGQGGMGRVYQAVHVELDREVAVKVLPPVAAEDQDAYQRFLREARAASRLRHPHILEVTDFDHTEEGTPFMVMEYLEGEDLGALLEREGRLPAARAREIFTEVLDAMEAAHRAGIVHRDLKPRNIFLCRYGSRSEYPKVLDFGISKIMDATSHLTGPESFLGTPGYMAPEQADGRAHEADARTDVFSLGAALYRALTGREPFGQGQPLSILYRVVNEEPAPLAELAPDLPAGVAEAVHRAMAKAPGDRHGSALELAVALGWASQEHPAPAGAGRATGRDISTGLNDMAGRTETPGSDLPPAGRRRAMALAGGALLLGASAVLLGVLRPLDRQEPVPGPAAGPDMRLRPAPDRGAPDSAPARDHEAAGPRIDGPSPLAGKSRGSTSRPGRSAARPVAPPAPAAVTEKPGGPDARAGRTSVGPGRETILNIVTQLDGEPVSATLYLDGRRLGPSPRQVKVEPGTHTIRAVREGYPPVDETVEAARGQDRRVVLELE